MMTLFDDEQILEAYAKDIDDSVTHREAKKTAEKLIRKGKMSLDEIAECVPSLSFDELKELEVEVMQAVQGNADVIRVSSEALYTGPVVTDRVFYARGR